MREERGMTDGNNIIITSSEYPKWTQIIDCTELILIYISFFSHYILCTSRKDTDLRLIVRRGDSDENDDDDNVSRIVLA